MKKLAVFLLTLVFTSAQLAMAQSVKVSGKIISAEDGEALPGVSVVVQGTSSGTMTDADGAYQISVPANATLEVSFVGMQSQDVPVQGRTRIDIKMLTELHSLEEVMVVAYGTAKKASYTGSAEMVKTKQIEQRTVGSVTKAIEGVVAGVQTTSGGGQPGSDNSIRIRGYGSIYASSAPLYVVDGVPYDGQINSINPSDIASISILKDAAASSLYGSRAANGVVIITTKKGSAGLPVINFKGTWGVSSRAFPNYDRVNQAEYMELAFESRKNDLDGNGAAALNSYWSTFGGETYNPYNMASNVLIDPNTGKVNPSAKLKWNDDWVDEALSDNPLRQDYQLSINGGTDKSQYLLSLGYLNEEGLAVNTKFERFTGRISLDTQAKEWIKTGMSAAFAQTGKNYLTNSGSALNNIWYSAMNMGPVYPVYLRDAATGDLILDADGERQYDYGAIRPYGGNFNSIATQYADKRQLDYNSLNGRVYADFQTKREDLDFWNDFKFSLNLGVNYDNGDRLIYQNPLFGDQSAVGGAGSRYSLRDLSYTFNQLLTWNRSFGKSNLDVLVGHEYYHMEKGTLYAQKTGYVLPDVTELSNAATPTEIESWKDNYNVESYLSRINYNYGEKYFLSASFRTDGSSRFHQDNRWGKFWSIGGAWKASEESFLQDVKWLNSLTVKSSFGTQGNDMLQDADANDIYYAWQSFYDTGYPNLTMGGVWKTSVENKELKWEKNENFNIGFESKLFNRVNFSAEYYVKNTYDLLLVRPLGTSLGYDGYWDNVGNMRNKGFDITLGVDIFRNDKFQWNLSVLASTVNNKITKLSDGADEIVLGNTILKVGEDINAFYLSKFAGVDPETGDRLYMKTDGETTTSYNTAAANRFISGSRIPDLYGSITNEFRYGGFDLNIMLTYSLGGKMLDYNYMTLMDMRNRGQALSSDMLNRWQKPGDITDVPRMAFGQQMTTTDQFLLDASYLSIKNVTIGYTIPQELTSKMKIQQLRVFATADNLFTFSSKKGMDPQNNFTGTTNYSYVPIRVISLGLDLKF